MTYAQTPGDGTRNECPHHVAVTNTCHVEECECPPHTPTHCSIRETFACKHEGTRVKTDVRWSGCMLRDDASGPDKCPGPDCPDYSPVRGTPHPAVYSRGNKGPDGDPDMGAESGHDDDASPNGPPDVDLVPDGDIPLQDRAAPCPDGGPEVDNLVCGMARNIFGKGGAIPVVAVVCRKSLDGRCTSSCAWGNYSRSIRAALQKVPAPSIIAPHGLA